VPGPTPFTAAVSGAECSSAGGPGPSGRVAASLACRSPNLPPPSLRPRNALPVAFLTQDYAAKLVGSVIGTLAYCGFALVAPVIGNDGNF
jgi:hypothetical protein